MQYSEGKPGRVFVLRLENGDRLPECIERFAAQKNVQRASCILLGGAGGGKLVVGPMDADQMPPEPILHQLIGAHEVAAVGTIFPNESGDPKLHMHAAMGRHEVTRTGCVRPGVDVWLVAEAVIQEIVDMDAVRKKDPDSGLGLLNLGEKERLKAEG